MAFPYHTIRNYLTIWIKKVDKKNILEILLFGSWIAIAGVSLDEFGNEYRLWRYNFHIIPQFPHVVWVHFVILPILYMLIYQYFREWRAFLKATIISSLAFSFIAEPVLAKLSIYELLKWNYIYSFPIYIVIGILFKAVIAHLKNKWQ